MTPMVLIGIGAVSTIVIIVAAWLMLRMSDGDIQLAARLDAARGDWAASRGYVPPGARAANAMQFVQAAVGAVGRWVMLSGLLPGKTRTELQQTLASSGFRGPSALPLFLGSKLLLLSGLPVLGWLGAQYMDVQGTNRLLMILGSAIAGMMAPDIIISRKRKASIARIEMGLPDALDLMVICAQAGLSLTPAMARVVLELRTSRPEVVREFEETLRELEMVADPAVALTSLGQRTGLDSLKRLGSTLLQTMQYGTPLSDALRILSSELRQQTLTRFEERAARLPVLLTLPMMIFILPCIFIIVGGPAVLGVMKALG